MRTAEEIKVGDVDLDSSLHNDPDVEIGSSMISTFSLCAQLHVYSNPMRELDHLPRHRS